MVFRKDRSVFRGGGLAVYVNSTIRCKSLSQFAPPAPQVSFVSATGCHISLKSSRYLQETLRS